MATPAASATDALYRIWRFPAEDPPAGVGRPVGTYYVESTAPDNVEDREGENSDPSIKAQYALMLADGLLPRGPAAVRQLAADLSAIRGAGHPVEVVVLIHGYNNPAAAVLERVSGTYRAVSADTALQDRPGLIYVGYRWPAEKAPKIAGGTLRAASVLASRLWKAALVLLVILLVVSLAWLVDPGSFAPFAAIDLPVRLLGAVLALVYLALLLVSFSIPFGLFVLRASVYFRDAYRAVNYGVPDLVDLLRTLDAELGKDRDARRVTLSFIGHSMGATVVTNLVHVLSDVFGADTPDAPRGLPNSQAANATFRRVPSDIGHALRLGRLVLVSPDISAEVLMMRRANFLKSSLRRFQEAYLFSSEGDGVLRLVSTLANYFSFPTEHPDFGYRLGNAEVLDEREQGPDGKAQYGILNLGRVLELARANESPSQDDIRSFLSRVRVGNKTLRELQERCTPTGEGAAYRADDRPFATHPTYFDCTDYIDRADGDPGPRAFLTKARRARQLPNLQQTRLLLQYVSPLSGKDRVDIHGGYFHGPFTRQLMYRLLAGGKR